MKYLAKLISNLLSKWDDTYRCVLPFATMILYIKYKNIRKYAFDALKAMSDINDDVYKALTELQFKIDDKHHDLRTIIQRGQICPTAMDKATVEIDATIWINDKLAPIQKYFVAYEIAGYIEVIATYDEQRDFVLFTMQPVVNTDMQYIRQFILVNTVITVLLFTNIAAAIMLYLA